MFDTYALIDPGSQFTFLLDRVTSFLELPCEAQASTTLQCLNTEHEMPLSKISETVTVTPFDKVNQQLKTAKTKLGWTLAGEYELSHKTMNTKKPPRQPFIYYVCRKDIEEEPLDELVQRFWKIEAEGTLPEKNEDSSRDQLAVQNNRKLNLSQR